MTGASCQAAVESALSLGYRHIDTGQMYGNETEVGAGLAASGLPRDSYFLTGKVCHALATPDTARASLDETLRRLRTDHLDLCLLHWPRADMDPLAIMEQLNAVVQSGKTRYIGCSNFPAWLVAHFNAVAASHGWAQLINNQIPYNLIERGPEVEVLPQSLTEQIAITCYRPLMAGVENPRSGVAGGGCPPPSRSSPS